MNEEFYWFWLGSIPGLGNTRILQLLQIFVNAKNIYDASDNMLKMTNILTQKDVENINETRRNSEIYIEYLNMKKNNIKIIPITAAAARTPFTAEANTIPCIISSSPFLD